MRFGQKGKRGGGELHSGQALRIGQDGPYSGYKGGEIIAQALSGNLQITGSPDREPLMIGGYLAQYAGGPSACAATLMVLFHSLMFGEGQHVDCSIVEANSDLLDR